MDELVKCDEQLKREKTIDKLLTKFHEKDIPDNIIHQINKKYPITKELAFLRTEQLEPGMFIKIISLDFTQVLNGSIINIKPNASQKYGIILLKSDDIFWRIKPDNYYIFKVERDSKKRFEMRNEIEKIKINDTKEKKENKKSIKK
jgi:hypothetical protein